MDKIILTEAKRRNEIMHNCKEWRNNGIEISPDDFYDIQTTFQLQEDIIVRLDDFDSQNKFVVCKHDEAMAIFENYIRKLICKTMEYVFFTADSTKFGALKLQGSIISNNLEYVISKSELLNGGCSIFICSYDLENGVCLWRGEYDSRIYFW